MNKNVRDWIVAIMVMSVVFCIGYGFGVKIGGAEGARQMARHILNPAFETESFYSIMNEECGSDKGWREMNGCIVFYKAGATIDGRHLTKEEGKLFGKKNND